MTSLPIVGITMGEPAGIGPEIAVKAMCDKTIRRICKPFILGDKKILAEARNICIGIPSARSMEIVGYDRFEDIVYRKNEIAVLDFKNVNRRAIHFGKDSAEGGRAAGEYIKEAIELALAGRIHAVVTGPISKVSFKMGGWGTLYTGHTEMFAALTGTKKYAMMLAHNDFRVMHVTTHVPLGKVLKLITRKRVAETIELANQACVLLGIKKPRICVCGVNPHAGEGGRMGQEEVRIVIPAIRDCQKQGINVTGPLPADTLWSKVAGGVYDIGVAMYHDQGHIPAKLLGFQYQANGMFREIEGINLTVGIPIIRVSVDHGVAYGKAGKGIASARSLIQAVEVATQLAQQKFRMR